MGRAQNLDLKKAWNVAFEAYIRELDAKKPVIWTGDLNVAPTEIGQLFTPRLSGRPRSHRETCVRPREPQA